jgi:hypothetical protein
MTNALHAYVDCVTYCMSVKIYRRWINMIWYDDMIFNFHGEVKSWCITLVALYLLCLPAVTMFTNSVWKLKNKGTNNSLWGCICRIGATCLVLERYSSWCQVTISFCSHITHLATDDVTGRSQCDQLWVFRLSVGKGKCYFNKRHPIMLWFSK